MTNRGCWTVVVGSVLTWSSLVLSAQSQSDYERPPIDYLKGPHNDPVFRLQKRIDAGQSSLSFDAKFGYLPAVLKSLGVPVTSQMLVFSKTSFQQDRISPRRPRALYFSDDVYVGWVQRGDVVEVSTVDPMQGAIFYSLDQQKTDKPRFVRQTDSCLLCHGSSHTEGVPGHFVRSVFPDRTGKPVFNAGTFRTDYTSPFEQRWGGWYVTGTHGRQRHMGNIMVSDRRKPENLDMEAGANVTDLKSRFDVTCYLTPHSDIVALMVLEHQIVMHNRMTVANYQTRITQRDAKIMNQALERDAGYESDSTRRRYDSAAEKVLETLLLVNRLTLRDPVKGTSRFADEFQQRGPFDHQGRSLRQLDLKAHLFRYPCSYLIYSKSFDALPTPVRDRILRRLWNVLIGTDRSEKFAYLTASDRHAILEILRDTKSDLPEYWAGDR